MVHYQSALNYNHLGRNVTSMAFTLALLQPGPSSLCFTQHPSLLSDQVLAKVTSSQCGHHVGLRCFLTSIFMPPSPASTHRLALSQRLKAAKKVEHT